MSKPDKPKEDLRQRAYLNAVTGGIDFSAKQIVGFILNPLLISFLGPVYYGAWKVIGQLNSYMVLADLRVSQPMTALLAKERSIRSNEELQKALSSAFYTMFLFSPLFIVAGILLVWFSPYAAGVDEMYFKVVRIASSFLAAAFMINQLLSIFDSVLAGMNLSYKRMGVRALITLFGGGLTALSLYMGYQLPGIAAVQVIIAVVTTVTLFWIVKKNVDWYGFTKVKIKDIVSFIKLSGWFMLWKIVRTADKSTDMVLLGMFAGPQFVASYAISKFLMNSASGFLTQVVSAVSPGVGKYIGEKQFHKLYLARSQFATIVLITATVFGAVICLWNKSFIYVWTDKDYFVGQLETLLIVLIGFLEILLLFDSRLINMTLDLRKKIYITAASAVLSIGLAAIFIPIYQTAGLLFSILVSQILRMIGYNYVIGQLLSTKHLFLNFIISRQSIICLGILLLSGFVGIYMNVTSWFLLVVYILFSFVTIGIILWTFALSAIERKQIISNLKQIKFFRQG